MRKFVINCDAGGSMQPFTIWVGRPKDSHNPLHFQAEWLSNTRGWQIPPNIMDAAAQLHDLSKSDHVPLVALFKHVFNVVRAEDSAGDESAEDLDEGDTNVDQET